MKIYKSYSLSDVHNYLDACYSSKRPQIILPNDVANVFFEHYKTNSFCQHFNTFKYELIVDFAIRLIKLNRNPQISLKLIELIVNDIKAESKMQFCCNEEIKEIIDANNCFIKYNLILKKYINDFVVTKSHVVVIGFAREHPLIWMLLDKQIDNFEIIYICASSDFIENNEIIKNRSIFFKKTEEWHKIEYPEIQGIHVLECGSIENEVQLIKTLVDQNKNPSLFINNLELLRRLEILIDGFGYNKPVALDFGVSLLVKVLDDNLSIEFLSTLSIKEGLDIQTVDKKKGLFFYDAVKGKEFVDAHCEYFNYIFDFEISFVAKKFIKLLCSVISNIELCSFALYKEIFLFLVQYVSYKSTEARLIAMNSHDFILNDDIAIVSTSYWPNDLDFYKLLHIKTIFILHNKNELEPEWLLKLRILLLQKYKTTYIEKKQYQDPIVGSIINPDASLRPKVFSTNMIEMLMRDPYAFYLRYMLNLKPNGNNETHGFITFVYDVLEWYLGHPCDCQSLLRLSEKKLEKYITLEQGSSLWWEKFKKIAQYFVQKNEERVGSIKNNQVALDINFGMLEYTIKVKCDIVEHLHDGSVSVVQYKISSLPSMKDIVSGLSMQLLLQGLAISKVLKKRVSKLAHWQLTSSGIIEQEIPDVLIAMDNAANILTKLLKGVPSMSFVSTGHYPQYQHIARMQEVIVSSKR